jgi:hypothetical protein
MLYLSNVGERVATLFNLNTTAMIKNYRAFLTRKELINDIEIVMSKETYNMVYVTQEPESITRDMIDSLNDFISHPNIHLYTNAGIDYHSSEKKLNKINYHRVSYDFSVEDLNLNIEN